MKTKLLAVLLLVIAMSAYSQTTFKGIVNWQPAPNFNDASLIGNGDMGAMVMGSPYDETIIVSQHNIFLPINMPPKPIDQLSRLDEIRRLIKSGNGTAAAEIPVEQSLKEGYGGQIWSDPYIPAFDLKIKVSAENIEKYQRSVDFNTAECRVDWTQNANKMTRRQFISRKDSLMVVSIKSDGQPFDADIRLAQHTVNWNEWEYINEHFKRTEISMDGPTVVYTAEFSKQWKPNIIGYQGFMQIKTTDGKTEPYQQGVKIIGAKEILFFVKVTPVWYGENFDKKNAVEKLFSSLSSDYDALLKNHSKIHGEIFNSVSLNLNGNDKDYNAFGETMMQQAKAKSSKAFVERQFNAARYNIICASGPNIPNLQGIWGNSWTPPWSSDYTEDGNVETAISSYLSSGLKDFLLPFFEYHEKMIPYYRENARRLYGCAGIMVPSHQSSHGYNVHFDKTWCLTFWTGGAAWISSYFYDYYLYTRDFNFLKNHAYPFMKEAAQFYEGFLTKDKNGKYEFNPSYSPENNPANNPSQACINATMDVALAKELLRNLIAVAPLVKENKAQINRWKRMLADLPDYQTDKNGFFKEWIDYNAVENHNHRHVSHLYGMYNIIDPEIKNNPELWDAVKKSYYERMKVRINDGGGVMVFGLCQMSWIAANIGDKAMYKTIIDWLSAHYWTNALGTYHDPNGLFNCDLSGGFQNSVIKGLVYSEPGYVKIFPSKPDDWDTGSISGVCLRGNATIKLLEWNNNKLKISLVSPITQTIKLELPSVLTKINGVAPKESLTTTNIKLDKNKVSEFEIEF